MIQYKKNIIPKVEDVIDIYINAGLPRPVNDINRMSKMLENSSLIITAWHNNLLIGISRCITDWVWSCYLADLAVRSEYQKQGIGSKLIQLTKENVGKDSMVLLLSVPTAMEYYPKVGFKRQESSFIIDRDQWDISL
jgi:ribosomal protein S18 acetylase RimI-like enzyme